jgi:uncharacterized protein YkwD
MRKPSPTGTMAFIFLCATVMSAVVVPATAQPLAGADSCGADVHTPPSTMDLETQGHQIREAIRCLINAERTSSGLPELTVNANLALAADGHAQRAASVQWWGEGDPHVDPDLDIDPVTGGPLERDAAIGARITRAGYCPVGATWVSEIAYTGAGNGCPLVACSTPAAAVNWWMNISTQGHREAILSPAIGEMGVGVSGDVANTDPAQNLAMEKGTYVVSFGACPD